VKKIFLIGQAADLIYKDLHKDFALCICENLENAVKAAAKEAGPGDSILLSPGCASYDMFTDYAHRGNEFKRIVMALSDF
jgi:UDP-N-acetylmuramoylalanine--D-glutamate ligase